MIDKDVTPISPVLTPAQEAVPRQDSRAHLDRALARGLAWTGIAKWSGQVVAWIATLIVARILTPSDYGIIALGTVYLGLVTLLAEFGLGSAVVMLRELDHDQVAQLNGFAVLTGFAGAALSFVFAPLMSSFFRVPELGPVILLMSVAFVISAPRIVPQSLLQKDLRFRALSLIDASQVAAQSLAMVVFAILGFRYWSIVLGGISGHIIGTMGTLLIRRAPFRVPRLASLVGALSFSRDVAVTRLAWYAYSRADFIIAGRLLGQNLTGFYSMAWSLASIPVDKLSSLVTKVTPAFFSAVQTDPAETRRYFLLLVQGLSLLSFPFAVGTALVAPDFTHVVLTDKWAGSIRPLQILSFYAAAASLTAVLTPILAAVRKQRFTMYANLVAALLLPAGFVLASRWGTTGIAAVWLVLHPPIVITLLHRVVQSTSVRWIDVGTALWPAFSATAAMAALVLGINDLWLDEAMPLLRLAVDFAAAAAAYTLVVITAHPAALRRLRNAVVMLRSGT